MGITLKKCVGRPQSAAGRFILCPFGEEETEVEGG